ncbi:hypothetical protein [Streptomyces mirabilis]
MEIFDEGTVSWYVLLNLLGNAASFAFAAFLSRRINRHLNAGLSAIEGIEGELGNYEYVLYLRQFEMDRRLFRTDRIGVRDFLPVLMLSLGIGNPIDSYNTREQNALDQFRRFGQIIAVGRPGERFPMPGAQRFYLPQDNWKPVVSDMMQHARLVLFLAGLHSENATADGTFWEFGEAVRCLPPHRVLLIVCGKAGDYRRFREAAEDYFQDIAPGLHRSGEASVCLPPLPAYPPLKDPKKLKRAIPLNGVIRFNPDWSSEFISFDPTGELGWTHRSRWRSTIRSRVDSFADQIERLLPGDATWTKTPLAQILGRWWIWLVFMASMAVVRDVSGSHTIELREKLGIIAVVLVGTAGFVWQEFLRVRHIDLYNVTVTTSEAIED